MNRYHFCLGLTMLVISAIGLSDTVYAQSKHPLTENLKACINGVYGLSNFASPDKRLDYNINSLIVSFDSLQLFSAMSGKDYIGTFSFTDSSEVLFNVTKTSLQHVVITNEFKYSYSQSIFMDSLLVCDRYSIQQRKILFFNGHEFRVSLMPYLDLLGLPVLKDNFFSDVQTFEVQDEPDNIKNDWLIITSKQQLDSLNLNVAADSIDFSKSNLVLFRCRSIQENNSPEFKRHTEFYTKNFSAPLYPVSYARLSSDCLDNQKQLNVICTYSRPLPTAPINRSKYSFVVLNKVDCEKLKLIIDYVQ
jgi:hypothetical protein